MIFSILVILVLLGVCCGIAKWRRTRETLYIVSAALFLAIGCGPIPAWLFEDLQSSYAEKIPTQWGQKNAIILLGAGTESVKGVVEPGTFSYARIVETVALYNDCHKHTAECQIIVSGGDAARQGTSEANVYQHSLSQLGVNAADVILEPDSKNTWQNAQFTCGILQNHDADRVVLVSSGFHLKRSTLYFAHFGIVTTPIRADYLHAIWSPFPLAYNFALTDFALQEYLGIARYHMYNLLGWNFTVKQGCSMTT